MYRCFIHWHTDWIVKPYNGSYWLGFLQTTFPAHKGAVFLLHVSREMRSATNHAWCLAVVKVIISLLWLTIKKSFLLIWIWLFSHLINSHFGARLQGLCQSAPYYRTHAAFIYGSLITNNGSPFFCLLHIVQKYCKPICKLWTCDVW